MKVTMQLAVNSQATRIALIPNGSGSVGKANFGKMDYNRR